ncbi:Trp family transcriptional regulator [Streptomyces sp. NPDC002547]
MNIRQDIAELLRQGLTQRQVRAQLHVSSQAVTDTRKALGIPGQKPHRLTGDALRADTERRYPVVAQMLRAGASLREITIATGTSKPTITRVRRILDIPVPDHRTGIHRTPTRTIAETLAHYTELLGDGHAHWTGPFNGARPTLWHRQRPLQARRVAFRAHHNREPKGYVRVGCEDPACIAGAHLADDTTRNADNNLDHLYDAIFGPTS